MQIKAANDTANYDTADDSGDVAVTVDGMIRLDPVSVQANVRGLDAARTGIVTAEDVVKLRPDLSVASVTPPPHALIGFPAKVVATIAEHNGDLGARANCRLLADGVEVDRAEGIWVDSGDRVDCRFTHTFDSAGLKNLQVVLDGVNPGDWDDANNSGSAELRVYEPQLFSGWTATARDEDFYDYSYAKNPWTERTSEQAGFRQVLTFHGVIPTPIALQSLQLTTQVVTDGQTMYDAQPLQFDGYFAHFFVQCKVANFGLITADVCQSNPESPWADDLTTVDLRYVGATVTYHSWGYTTALSPAGETTFNYVRHEDTNPTRLGNTVAFDVVVTDGQGAWHAQPFISSITASTTSSAAPLTCVYSRFYGGQSCMAFQRHAVVRSGSVSGR